MPRKGSNKLNQYTDYIIKQYNDGIGATTIAKQLNCGQCAVLSLLRNNGVEIRPSKAERITSENDIDNFIKLYMEENSTYKIAQLTGFSNLTVCRHLRNSGYDVSAGQKKRDDPLKNHREAIIEQYNSGTGIYTIAKQYKASETAVGDIIRKEGIEIRGIETYSIDESYFEKIDTENKAYWLGFLYADGSVQDKGAFELTIADLDGCEKLKSDIQYQGPILTSKTIREKHHKIQYTLKINRIKMANDLIKLGCFINKTFKVKFPTIEQVPIHLVKYFIRGIFDGDGSVFRDKNCRWGINFIGCEPLIRGIESFIFKEIGIKFTTGKTQCKTDQENKIVQIMFGGRLQVFKFLNWLYKDSQVHLDRKYSLYKQLESELVTES